MSAASTTRPRVAVIGGGPAGLMAAEVLATSGMAVNVFDAMPSVGRKFLLAGKGGLNLTHSEPIDAFVGRYRPERAPVEGWLQRFGPAELREWARGLGIDTFVGSSGRVFPADMKAAPLLRAWLHRLREAGVGFHMRHRWLGWRGESPTEFRFATAAGPWHAHFDAVVLALGGGSWSRLGSDGAWMPWLQARGVQVAPLQPSNCGFDVGRPTPDGSLRTGWSEHFHSRYVGHPLKNVALRVGNFVQPGECVVTTSGIEGSLVYAASSRLREAIAQHGQATLWLDLLPGRSQEHVAHELAHPRGPRSLATHLKSRLGLHGVKAGLLYECVSKDDMADPQRLAGFIKALPIVLVAPRPIDEAISSAGGVAWGSLNAQLMLHAVPGVFCAGEMIDWEAPTGGYLLTASMASGRVAGQGVRQWLDGAQVTANETAHETAHETGHKKAHEAM